MTIIDHRPFLLATVREAGEIVVEACAADGGGRVPMTVENVTDPVTSDGWTTYLVWLVGPAAATLTTPGRHRVHQDGRTFFLNLTRVGRRGSLVSYAAVVVEPA